MKLDLLKIGKKQNIKNKYFSYTYNSNGLTPLSENIIKMRFSENEE